jgi:hypothetical protein
MFSNTPGTVGSNGIINTTYYIKDAIGPYVAFRSDTPMTITPKHTVTGQLQYSTDLETWNNIASGETTISSDTIYMRGIMNENRLFNSSTSSNAWEFTDATNLRIAGNLNNLLNYEDPPTTIDNYCYSYMFYNCTSLTKISEGLLQATTLANYCYQYMFYNCTKLTALPENLLPATTLAEHCYSGMFFNCTSLINAPKLPALELADYCYNNMFSVCTSLVEIQEDILPATTLANYCYAYMFLRCTSLTILPLLPATILTNNCYYYMFYDCNAIIVNNISSVGYTREFRIPTLDTGLIGTNSLGNMFLNTGGTMKGTPSINTTYYIKDIKCAIFTSDTPMTITPKHTVTGQLQYSTDGTIWTNIASGETTISSDIIYIRGIMSENRLFNSSTSSNAWTFTNATNLEINGILNALLNYNNPPTTIDDYCYTGMFYNCAVLTTISENLLPALTLASYCYQRMFNSCTSLTNATILPATTLANYCYENMFNGCTSLTEMPEDILPATTLATYCYRNMFSGCSSLTEIPENLLPAATLANYCYLQMFNGCTSLVVNNESSEGYTREFRIPTSGTGTIGTNSLSTMFTNTAGTMNSTPDINTTYYIKD